MMHAMSNLVPTLWTTIKEAIPASRDVSFVGKNSFINSQENGSRNTTNQETWDLVDHQGHEGRHNYDNTQLNFRSTNPATFMMEQKR